MPHEMDCFGSHRKHRCAKTLHSIGTDINFLQLELLAMKVVKPHFRENGSREMLKTFTFYMTTHSSCFEIVPTINTINQLTQPSSQVTRQGVFVPIECVIHQFEHGATNHALGY